MIEVPRYEHTERDVQETATAAIEYIIGGDTLNAVFDIRGLLVYGVIGALREHDDLFYGPNSSLSPEEITRLAEVEDVVDKAVKYSMQFYPFGEKRNKWDLDSKTRGRLGAKQRESNDLPIARKNVARVRLERIHRNDGTHPSVVDVPVTTYKIPE
jgi:hypothetical protein